jgi:putative membrane protein insertion efficiency factor
MTAKLLILLIRAYQVVLSPFLGGACRFQPSCSAYAIEAIATHGPWHGGVLAARRLSRCHPLGRAGFDPVPASRPSTRLGTALSLSKGRASNLGISE